MMSNLHYRQEKIQSKRKTTPWRDFVMEICSRQPLVLNKNLQGITRFPTTIRKPSNTINNNHKKNRQELNNDMNNNYTGDFFKDYNSLYHKAYIPNLGNLNTENCDYCDNGWYCKDCYLSYNLVQDISNTLYSFHIKENCNNVLDTRMARVNCSNIYQCGSIISSYNIFYSRNITDSSNIWFSKDLKGCLECILCNDLENKKYHIENKEYSKEEYLHHKKVILQNKQNYESWFSDLGSHKPFIFNSQAIENGYNVYNVTSARNVINIGSEAGNNNFYDVFMGGSPSGNHMYGNIYIGPGEHIYCCDYIGGFSYNFYSYLLESCSFCLGCIGLKNKSYCILNKQYTKEERYEKVDEIFAQMEKDGTLGEFFPATMNPFYFNDTAAYLIDNTFTKDEVIAKGYLWRDEPIKVDIPEGAKVVKTSELDQYEGWINSNVALNSIQSLDAETSSAGQKMEGQSRWIDPEILKCIIQDEQGNVYKIVKIEYDFLMKYGLPLPRKHRLERMKENFKIQ